MTDHPETAAFVAGSGPVERRNDPASCAFAILRIHYGQVPATRVVLYLEEDGSCPFLEWFEKLPTKAQDKCYLRLERLREMGHELRRPEADYLRDGIHELRVSLSGVHHRILYFFHGAAAAVVSHGLAKNEPFRRRKLIAPLSARNASRRIRRSTLLRRLEMAKRTKSTVDGVDILHRKFYAGRPTRLRNLEEARANEEIARKIHELRTEAGLTQTQLARLLDTTASVICRLEDAEYEGHSLAMLRRIAGALQKRVEIRFVPVGRSA